MNTAKLFLGIIFAIIFLSILIKFTFKPISKDYYKEGKQKRMRKLEIDMKNHFESFQIRKQV